LRAGESRAPLCLYAFALFWRRHPVLHKNANKSINEIEKGKSKLIPHDEFMEEPGISDERSAEEVERDRKEHAKIAARNKEVHRLLLG